jgi:CO/xanthine dehydrogenase FAD-binding subunit
VEERLAGAPLDEATATAALREFCAGLSPPTSPHADATYRKEVASIVALRALRRAWDRAGGR